MAACFAALKKAVYEMQRSSTITANDINTGAAAIRTDTITLSTDVNVFDGLGNLQFDMLEPVCDVQLFSSSPLSGL